ncbi:MAG: ParB/RepB/Spo0J family partition protein [Oscillospiraceae bacterium]|nr:ParB/RepB/Spo0J family partition protein [Oscillospiraceae bacterium]
MAKRNSGLGRGLDSLFLSSEQQISDASASSIKLSDIDVDPGQPRKTFENQSLEQLSQSILEHGVLQPIVLMPNGIGRYTIIAGERRFRAARMAGLTEIPAIVKDVSTQSAKEIALIENLQREDLDPVEIAYGYKSLMESFNLTQDEISQKLSIPRSSIANSLRILNLPEDILEMIKTDEISLGHAKVILSVSDEKMQRELAQQTAEKQLSVRQCELLAKSMVKKPKTEKQSKVPSIVKEVEIALSEMHGTPVRISYKDGKGSLNITFNSQEQLLELANLLEKK